MKLRPIVFKQAAERIAAMKDIYSCDAVFRCMGYHDEHREFYINLMRPLEYSHNGLWLTCALYYDKDHGQGVDRVLFRTLLLLFTAEKLKQENRDV